MDANTLIEQAKRIIDSYQSDELVITQLTEASEFLRVNAGSKSGFYKQMDRIKTHWSAQIVRKWVNSILMAFIKHVESGLFQGVSIERKAQIDVVSDFLHQATLLLESKGVHPAAPTVIIGAALEEYLRNWVDGEELKLGSKKPSIDTYAKLLREAELITKQDIKDITGWAGLRNHASHGEWEEVGDKSRIRIMLEAVNLFMRKYGESK